MTLDKINIALNQHLKKMPTAPPILIFDNAPTVNIPLGAFALEAVLLPARRQAVDFCLSIEQSGIYSINVFAPLAKGATAAQQLAEQVATHFAYTRLSSLQCTAANISRVGKVGEHFVYNVSVDYRAWE